jgi:hypothetical protein
LGEQELEALLKSQGWSMGKVPTGKQHYYQAKKYTPEGNITRYIATTRKLAGMTTGDVLAKLKE